MNKRLIQFMVCLLVAGFADLATAQSILTPPSTINVAGKQRFLSHRLGKDHSVKFTGSHKITGMYAKFLECTC